MPKIKELAITVVPEGFGPVGIGGGGGCSDCTVQAFSICGGTNQGGCGFSACSDCTVQPFSICGGTQQQCQWQTVQPCGQWSGCSDCTVQPFSICGTTPGPQCFGGTRCGFGSPVCGVSRQPEVDLTKAQIDQLKAQLKHQMEALEAKEKELLPKTIEAIEIREKEIAAELEQLKNVKAELKKK